MINTEFPLKKTYEQDFILDGKTLFTLKYKQATMEEYHEFFALSDEDRSKEMYSLIKPQFPLQPYEKVMAFVFKGYRGKAERHFDIELLAKNILANRFRAYNSIFKSEASDQSGLFSANVSMVCQKYCISPTELFREYTIEQFSWLIDGIIYQGNLMDDEGRFKNKKALTDVDAIKERAQFTREQFEKEQFETTQDPTAPPMI